MRSININGLLYRIKKETDMLPLRSNRYLDEFIQRHHKGFCCLGLVLSIVTLAIGTGAVIFNGELWFILLFLIFGALGLISILYFLLVRCIVDTEKIEKRALFCKRRVRWDDVDIILDVRYTGQSKRIICVYGKRGLLVNFESPMTGMDELLDMAKQKCIKVKRCRDLTAHQILKPEVKKD